jgi:hypothetical protein
VSAAYQTTPTAEVERFYDALLAWAGVTLPVKVSGAPIEARLLDSGPDTTLLFLFNHGKQAAQSEVLVRGLASAATATDLADNRAVTLTPTAEGIALTTEIEPGGVRVLRVARR